MLSSRRGSMQYSSRCRLRRAGHDYLFDVCFQTSGRDWSAEGMLHTSVIQHHFTYSNCPCQGTASSPVQVKPVVFLVAELMRLTVRHLDQPTPSKKKNWLQNPLTPSICALFRTKLYTEVMLPSKSTSVNSENGYWSSWAERWDQATSYRYSCACPHVAQLFATREAKRHAQGVAELSYARHQDI